MVAYIGFWICAGCREILVRVQQREAEGRTGRFATRERVLRACTAVRSEVDALEPVPFGSDVEERRPVAGRKEVEADRALEVTRDHLVLALAVAIRRRPFQLETVLLAALDREACRERDQVRIPART